MRGRGSRGSSNRYAGSWHPDVRKGSAWGAYGPRRSRRRAPAIFFGLVFVAALAGVAAVSTNALGMGDRFDHVVQRVRLFVDPPPDRPITGTVQVTEAPLATP